jgi:hypothetical protein
MEETVLLVVQVQ